MQLAPIVLFTYNRFFHTQKTIEALLKNEYASESDLFIYSDAPKNSLTEESVRKTREYIRTITGFNTITIIERETNYGLSSNIIEGVTEIVNKYGKIIVLEDDLQTSPFFLRYMNEALTTYENEDKVISIHGYIFPIKKKLPHTFFLRGADCWGWATWKRGWDVFEPDGVKLLTQIEATNQSEEFDYGSAFPYSTMLKEQIEGKNDSWAIRWYASAFLKNKLTLYPNISLVKNIGLDNSGTHCGKMSLDDTYLAKNPIIILPIEPEESILARRYFGRHLSILSRTPYSTKIKLILKKIHNKLH